MARGRKCRKCGYYMYAEQELNQPMGRLVRYVCLNKRKPCFEAIKVFEEYPK